MSTEILTGAEAIQRGSKDTSAPAEMHLEELRKVKQPSERLPPSVIVSATSW